MTSENEMAKGLTEKFQLLKNEVDALQIAVTSQRTPWYKNISTLISILALLFSFGTTIVSYVRAESQDIQNLRIELRGLLQRISNLPRENFELSKKYADDPSAISTLSGLINQENSILARQAAEIARKIPRDYVSATEFYAVATALQAAYNNEGAKQFLDLAIESSKDFSDKIAALRARANLFFLSGQPEAGRVEYQKALNIFSDYEGYDDYTKKSTHILSEISWAFSEANYGSYEQAMQHIANSENIVSGLLPSPGVDYLKRQIMQARATLAPPSSPSNLPKSNP